MWSKCVFSTENIDFDFWQAYFYVNLCADFKKCGRIDHTHSIFAILLIWGLKNHNFIRMLTSHRLQNSSRQKELPVAKGPPEGHQNVAAWHIMHIMHIIAFGKPWWYCMKLIITSQEDTNGQVYPEKILCIFYAAHQKATKCGPRP